jgi:hypothetical protein
MRKLKAYETIHEPSQFIKVTRLPADPFMFIGKICIISEECSKFHICYKHSFESTSSEYFVLVSNLMFLQVTVENVPPTL